MINPYPTLGDYAIIGNGQSAALVSRYGSIDWLCWPDFSSPSIFSYLLDRERGGCFAIGLKDPIHISRRYFPETAILETEIHNAQGAIRLTDCMTLPVEAGKALTPMRELLRYVEVVDGKPELQVVVDARPDYGAGKGQFTDRKKLGWALNHRHFLLNLLTDFPLSMQGEALTGSLCAKAGDVFTFSLTFDNKNPAIFPPLESASQRIVGTAEWWQQWCSQYNYTGPWRDAVLRSAITLRLLTFNSGALLAAATTSLPEKLGGEMNWDYRYCWPRDAALSLSAFFDIGLRDEADAFFYWLMMVANVTRPRINVVYDVWGRDKLHERILPLAGYRGSRPVRIGNAAHKQIQHDVYGEVMLAVEDWLHHFGKPQRAQRQLIEGFGRVIVENWREPDTGIWELRDKPRHYTYSKVMAWYVLDSLIRQHGKGRIHIPVEHYRKERAALRQAIETQGFNAARNSFTGVFDEDTLDASLLLLPRCGFVPYDDPRMWGTWQAIQQDLECNGLIMRYPPGFAGSEPGEAVFLICNFWAVDYLSGCRRKAEAERRLVRLMRFANDVGLYSEGVDAETQEALGNIPQAFSHAGLINSVMQLYAGKGQHEEDQEEEAAAS